MLALSASRSYCKHFSNFYGQAIKCASYSNYIRPVNKLITSGHNVNVKAQLNKLTNQRFYATASTTNSNAKSDENNLIYFGPLATRMKMVKVFSLSTSLAGMAAQPVLLEQGMKMGGTALAVFFCTFAGFFTFVTPLLLHFITKKYVTEIHYNAAKDEYTATTISIILHKIKTKFQPADVKVPEIPGMFTSFVVGKKALFVDASFFTDPEHYARIMGYDKPVDFKLDMKEIQQTTLKKEEQQKS